MDIDSFYLKNYDLITSNDITFYTKKINKLNQYETLEFLKKYKYMINWDLLIESVQIKNLYHVYYYCEDLINLELLKTHQNLTSDIKKLIRKKHLFFDFGEYVYEKDKINKKFKKHIIINNIDKIIEKNIDIIHWDLLSKYRYLSIALIIKYEENLNWDIISKRKIIKDKKYLDKFKEKLNWDIISREYTINEDEELLDKFKEYLNWDIICEKNICFISIFINFNKYLNWDIISSHKNLSIYILKKYKEQLNWDIISKNLINYNNYNQILKIFKNKIKYKNLSFIQKIKYNLYKFEKSKDLLKEALLENECENECSICYENLVYTEMITKCKHIFHNRCINKWLITNNTCPNCRRIIK